MEGDAKIDRCIRCQSSRDVCAGLRGRVAIEVTQDSSGLTPLEAGELRVRRLGRAGDVEGLRRELDNPEESWHIAVRASAAKRLGDVRDSASVERLIEMLASDRHEHARIAAAFALGRIGDPRSLEPLITATRQENDVARVAVVALGEIRDRRAVQALVEHLRDKDWRMRRVAAEALAAIGAREAIKPIRDLAAREPLLHRLTLRRVIRRLDRASKSS
jgi:HEAT repeat protein